MLNQYVVSVIKNKNKTNIIELQKQLNNYSQIMKEYNRNKYNYSNKILVKIVEYLFDTNIDCNTIIIKILFSINSRK